MEICKRTISVIGVLWPFPWVFNYLSVRHLLLSCTSQMTTNLYQSSCPRVACGFHCFHFDQWEIYSTGWTFKDRYSDPRTRERNNVLDQLVPSHTQRGQANGQLVPHQLKPTTGKYLSSLRHLRSRLLVKSLPNIKTCIAIIWWILSVLNCSWPKCGLWCAPSGHMFLTSGHMFLTIGPFQR